MDSTDAEEKERLIALNSVPYITPETTHSLLDEFGSARAVFRAKTARVAETANVTQGIANCINEMEPAKVAQRELDYADRVGASIVTHDETAYPKLLSETYAPPPVISIAGELLAEDRFVLAVVGPRRPTSYGNMLTEKLVTGLVKAGVTIVSGLASGIDGLAHKTALREGGRTIAVIGCGLNIYYPPHHRELQKRIAQGRDGAVISQFPFTTEPSKVTFPMRNRIISGLSLGTLIIEAAQKSGALITAYASLNENRGVFALPGQVNSKTSYGTNSMIKKGHAKLVQDVDDILEELPGYEKQRLKQKQIPLIPEEPLTDEEERIFKILDHKETHIDRITQETGLPAQMVSAILLALELKERVKQAPGKFFIKV